MDLRAKTVGHSVSSLNIGPRHSQTASLVDRFVGERITAARKSAGLTAAALAERSAIHVMALATYEGGAARPAPHELRRIATAAGVPISELLAS